MGQIQDLMAKIELAEEDSDQQAALLAKADKVLCGLRPQDRKQYDKALSVHKLYQLVVGLREAGLQLNL